MKTATFLFAFIFVFSVISKAQPGFNLIHKTDFPRNRIYDMIVDNDTIICLGLAYPDSSFSQQGILLVKFDSSGSYISSNLVLDEMGDNLAVDYHWGKLAESADGNGYAAIASAYSRKSVVFIMANKNLELKFTKEYPDTFNLSNYFYKIIPTFEGYLLNGAIQRPNFLNNSFIRRIDNEGNTVWFNYYGDYDDDGVLVDLKMIDDSTMIAASVDQIGTNGSHSTLRIIGLENGAVLDSFVSETDPEIGYLRKVMPFPDGGGFLTYGVSVVEVTPFGTKLVQPTFARFSADFDLLWVKRFGKIYNLATGLGFLDIEQTLDGQFVATGRDLIVLPDGNQDSAGSLMKFTEYGDSLWARYDQGPYPPNYIYAHHFSGVGVLSSGNIVAAGTATLGMDENIWLVKVTTDGCMDTILCEPITGIVEQAKGAAGEMKVYPNPATESVAVELPPGAGQGEILVHNLQGGLVLRETFNGGWKVALDVSGLGAGVYFLSAKSAGRVFRRTKLIIAK